MDSPKHGFWTNKLDYLETQGVHVYRGRVNSSGQEKGVDVSLALDLVQATYEQWYETAIIVSQDADFGPAVFLAKNIARVKGRLLLFESAFSVGSGTPRGRRRGVPGTRWVHIDQTIHDACCAPGLPASAPVMTSSVQFLPRPKDHQLRRVGVLFPSTAADRASPSASLSM